MRRRYIQLHHAHSNVEMCLHLIYTAIHYLPSETPGNKFTRLLAEVHLKVRPMRRQHFGLLLTAASCIMNILNSVAATEECLSHCAVSLLNLRHIERTAEATKDRLGVMNSQSNFPVNSCRRLTSVFI